MYINEAAAEQHTWQLPQSLRVIKAISVMLLLLAVCFAVVKYNTDETEQNQTLTIISNPKINDIYFLDFRLLSDNLRPKEKYRLAKVVDITGDIITLLYSDFFYQYQHAAVNSIQYGQLSYKDYFSPKRYNLPHNTIKNMYSEQAIYLAKRPINNKLFGSLVGPARVKDTSSHLLYGKKENIKGQAFFNDKFNETNLQTAFEYFQRSANLGYSKGQVNLAQMYINGQHVKKDFNQALHWLKQASLQSNKPAILKYGIICKQVQSCYLADFYQEITAAGVNIRVRKMDVKLSSE